MRCPVGVWDLKASVGNWLRRTKLDWLFSPPTVECDVYLRFFGVAEAQWRSIGSSEPEEVDPFVHGPPLITDFRVIRLAEEMMLFLEAEHWELTFKFRDCIQRQLERDYLTH